MESGVSAYLASLDKAMGYTLMSHIDGGSGTSAGALLISLLMCGYSPADIDSVAIQEHKKMFDGVGFPQCLNLLRANKYKGKFAKSLLQKMLGDIKVKDVKKPIFLTGCNMATQEEIIFSHEYNSDWPLWKAALVSMSAPSYFPLVDGKYGDGAAVNLFGNNGVSVTQDGTSYTLGLSGGYYSNTLSAYSAMYAGYASNAKFSDNSVSSMDQIKGSIDWGNQIAAKTAQIIPMLQTGSFREAGQLIDTLEPDEFFTVERLAKYKDMLAAADVITYAS